MTEREELLERADRYLHTSSSPSEYASEILRDMTAFIRRMPGAAQAPTVGVLHDIFITMRHARTFITSREKMNPTGVELWDKLFAQIEALQPSPASSTLRGSGKPICQNCGDPVADALHAAGFCGTCREMGCTVTSTNCEAPGHTDLMVTPESIDAWLEKNPLPECTCGGEAEQPADHHDISCPLAVPPAHSNTEAG